MRTARGDRVRCVQEKEGNEVMKERKTTGLEKRRKDG
jgi:hypothetical protein